MSIESEILIADTIFRYHHDPSTGRVGLLLYPRSLRSTLARHRKTLRGEPEIDNLPGSPAIAAIGVDPLVHVKLIGDPYPGAFAQGRTMRNSPSNDHFRFRHQKTRRDKDRHFVITTLATTAGLRIEHELSWFDTDSAAQITTRFFNDSQHAVSLEMLSSFSLGGISPFDASDSSGRLRVHRFRSVWSAEARLDTQAIEGLHLERSWSGSGLFSERFGQVGTMPVRGWFPFVAVEDTVSGVVWGAQLAWAGSWQMEISRQDDQVCISGGLADREFGQWTRRISPGESMVCPPAFVACVAGNLDDLCDRLTALQTRTVEKQPTVERDLPIIVNEWCTTWGDPSHDRLVQIARRIKRWPVKYLVIDAGWYKTDSGNWDNGHGDWIPSRKLFPTGLPAAAEAIRNEGLIPGLWFEMETIGEKSAAFSLTDHLLHRDGMPVTVRSRRFWDLNDPWTIRYLTKHVIDLMERCGFGYMKVDYNETLGIGCEVRHPKSTRSESLGEGLRRQVCAVHEFFDRIRQRLPELVIENCSSGGHRLEPSMLSRTAMSSFSDAHELREIPIIAANLHRLILPRQSQIWAVLHRSDSIRRLRYSLAAAFLGRMCLSGEVDRLRDEQNELVSQACDLYRKTVPAIRHGRSRRFGQMGESWRHPSGWQAVFRTAAHDSQALAIVHTFANGPKRIEIPLPGNWKIIGQLSGNSAPKCTSRMLVCHLDGDFDAAVVLLGR
jgi:alpha-galactosidase